MIDNDGESLNIVAEDVQILLKVRLVEDVLEVADFLQFLDGVAVGLRQSGVDDMKDEAIFRRGVFQNRDNRRRQKRAVIRVGNKQNVIGVRVDLCALCHVISFNSRHCAFRVAKKGDFIKVSS